MQWKNHRLSKSTVSWDGARDSWYQGRYTGIRSQFACPWFEEFRVLWPESVSQPVTQLHNQSASHSASQPVTQVVSQSVTQPVSQPVTQPVSQPNQHTLHSDRGTEQRPKVNTSEPLCYWSCYFVTRGVLTRLQGQRLVSQHLPVPGKSLRNAFHILHLPFRLIDTKSSFRSW